MDKKRASKAETIESALQALGLGFIENVIIDAVKAFNSKKVFELNP